MNRRDEFPDVEWPPSRDDIDPDSKGEEGEELDPEDRDDVTLGESEGGDED